MAAQSMPSSEFEVILVADRIKTSDAEALLKTLISNYRVYESDKPGIVNALNLGLSKSKGIYVARMDEDDLMEPNRLTQQSSHLDTNSDCVAVGGQLKLINEKGESIGVSRFSEKVVHKKELLRRSPIAHPAAMFRRENVINIGGYRENLPEDWDLWTRLWQEGSIENLGDYVLRYRIHENQLSRTTMYKHSTSRLIIGTSLYARENGLRDYPVEYTDIDNWLIQSGRALSELTDEYKSFASDVKRESKVVLNLSSRRGLNDILKLSGTVLHNPQYFFQYTVKVVLNRYYYWKIL
jgi:glycosyltransferase involved in cell wall biosynthesis